MKPKIKLAKVFKKNVPGITEISAQKTVAIAGLGGLTSESVAIVVNMQVNEAIEVLAKNTGEDNDFSKQPGSG